MNRLGLLAVLLASGAWAQESTTTLAPSPLQLPRRIGPMSLDAAPHKFDDPRLGVSYQYRGPGASLTVYVYDAGVEGLKDGPDTIPTCQEFEIAKQGVAGAPYQDIRLVSEHSVRLLPPEDTLLVREAVFEFVREQQPTISYLWITGAAGHFIKLRFSSDEQLRSELPEARRTILAALGEAIKPHLAPVDPKAEERGTAISLGAGMLSGSDDDMASAFMYSMLLITAAEKNPQLAPVCGGEIQPAFATELSLFRGVFALNKADESRFGRQVAKIDSAGFLEEFIWVERHREYWGGTAPDGLTLPEYAAWKKKHLKRLRMPTLGGVAIGYPRALPPEPPSSP
jgi:hypothetical protein